MDNGDGGDKHPSEGPKAPRNGGNVGRTENKTKSEQPSESSRTGVVKKEDQPEDSERSPHRDSNATNFDNHFPVVIVRRLRTWAGPIDSIELSPAERANMSSNPGPRKRVRM